jgi:hypothetical protein
MASIQRFCVSRQPLSASLRHLQAESQSALSCGNTGDKTDSVQHRIVVDELNKPTEPFFSFGELRSEVVIDPDHRGIYDE